MKNLCRPSHSSVMSAINRCYFEADHGRVSLALERLKELAYEFKDNAHVAYAEGTIRRDYLGQGLASRALFEKAYHISVAEKLTRETRWFSICNAIDLAGNGEKYQKWTEVAFKEKGAKKAECQQFAEVLRVLDTGRDYARVLVEKSLIHLRNQDYGLGASILEIALLTEESSRDELKLRKQRALSLRALDAAAQRCRDAKWEAFPSEERLTLHEALTEIDKCIALDEYDAELWNYRSAWCIPLGKLDEAIRSADKAIELRPHNYPRPHDNKAMALWRLQRDDEAIACAREAVRQAETGRYSSTDVEQANALINSSSKPRVIPTLDELRPVITGIVRAAIRTSEEEFDQIKSRLTFDQVVHRLVQHTSLIRRVPFIEFVPLIVELLSDFTPETAFRASLQIAEREKSEVECCLVAALYIAVYSESTMRRDATRYLCLITLMLVDSSAIRAYYRSAFLETSSAATGEMARLDSIIREELARINPLFPQLIADQEAVDEKGRQRAILNILSQFA